MAWAVGNARVEPKGNAILVTKQASGSVKIVPLMAAFNAIALMAMNPWSARSSIFVIYRKSEPPTHLSDLAGKEVLGDLNRDLRRRI
jgi:phage terminase large subunit-like protein